MKTLFPSLVPRPSLTAREGLGTRLTLSSTNDSLIKYCGLSDLRCFTLFQYKSFIALHCGLKFEMGSWEGLMLGLA